MALSFCYHIEIQTSNFYPNVSRFEKYVKKLLIHILRSNCILRKSKYNQYFQF